MSLCGGFASLCSWFVSLGGHFVPVCWHFECLYSRFVSVCSCFEFLYSRFVSVCSCFEFLYSHFVSVCSCFEVLCSLFASLCGHFSSGPVPPWPLGLSGPVSGRLFSNASMGMVVAQHRSVTSNWLDMGEWVQLSSTDRCTDPVHPWRCHLHFIGHLGPASIFNSHLDAIKGQLLSSGCPEDFPAAPAGPLAS